MLLCIAIAPLPAQSSFYCRGQRIDSIAIDAQAPTVSGLRRVPLLGDLVRSTHIITRADVIRGYLLLRVGDQCSELRRSESERILRAQPFIADAVIEVRPNMRGGVLLDVQTIDEASIILSGALSTKSPQLRSAKLGSSNLAGLGVALSFGWRHEPAFQDRLHFQLSDYQFAGRPYVLNAASLRDAFSRDERAELTLPFRTDVQRFAWRTLAGESRGHAQFVQRDSGRLALGFAREYLEAGGIARAGPPGALTLLGFSFTNERAWPDTTAKLISDSGFRADTAAGFAGRFMETRAARVNALIGLRGLRFKRVRGFDALRGAQDIPLGLQLGTLIGRGIQAMQANSNDMFLASDLYIGLGTDRLIYRLQAQAEGRRARGGEWDGLVGSGRFSRYSRVSDTRTRVFSVEWSGTEKVRVPHTLSLGVVDGGIRGYRNTTTVGARRGIARIDEQMYMGSPKNFGDLGIAYFVDAGQLWAGDLPYGDRTRIRTAVGASLLLAVPIRSTRMWRLEFAAPLNREPGADKWELRLSHSDRTTFFWREPSDVDAARARAVPASVYSWP
jgi:hypothetical protein